MTPRRRAESRKQRATTKAPAAGLVWARRSRRHRTTGQRTWPTACGRYQVREYRVRGEPIRWHAMRLEPEIHAWDFLPGTKPRQFLSRASAIAAVEAYHLMMGR